MFFRDSGGVMTQLDLIFELSLLSLILVLSMLLPSLLEFK